MTVSTLPKTHSLGVYWVRPDDHSRQCHSCAEPAVLYIRPHSPAFAAPETRTCAHPACVAAAVLDMMNRTQT